jgi:hypothetical protein
MCIDDDENLLSATNFIRHIPKTFKGTSSALTDEPQPRYVVKGIRARSNRPDLAQKAADWLREPAERDAGDQMELVEVKPTEENKQAKLLPDGLPFDWLQETKATEPVEEPVNTPPANPDRTSSPQPRQPPWECLERPPCDELATYQKWASDDDMELGDNLLEMKTGKVKVTKPETSESAAAWRKTGWKKGVIESIVEAKRRE